MICPITGNALGYTRHMEDRAGLLIRQRRFTASAFTADLPDEIDLSGGKIPVKNQGSVGACTGFSRATGEEILNLLRTGQYIELSPQFAYIENQKAAGMLGSDNGATIEASVRAAAETGICTEAVCPWPGRYVPSVLPAAESEGRLHLIAGHAVLTQLPDVRAWLGHRQGPVLIGVTWTEGMSQCLGGIIDNIGRPIGGHALVLIGYQPGYFLMRNSWGEQWGSHGNALVADSLVSQWLTQGEAIIGISDLAAWGPRQVNSWEGVA